MTANMAERKLNCIGWSCVTADCSELGPQPDHTGLGVFFCSARDWLVLVPRF
jgi:hypothetical protein